MQSLSLMNARDSAEPARPDPGRVTVLVVDDFAVVRVGWRAMLASDERVAVVGEAGDGREALDRVAELRPDVVLMDLVMPGVDGLEATRGIAKASPAAAVVIVTDQHDDGLLVAAITAGAVGFVAKDATRELVCQAVVAAANGAILIKASLVRSALVGLAGQVLRTDGVRSGSDQSEERRQSKRLTDRDQAVLSLIAEGCTNKQIGEALAIAEVTVKKHVQAIMAKLGVADRTQAAITALRSGIVPLESGRLRQGQ